MYVYKQLAAIQVNKSARTRTCGSPAAVAQWQSVNCVCGIYRIMCNIPSKWQWLVTIHTHTYIYHTHSSMCNPFVAICTKGPLLIKSTVAPTVAPTVADMVAKRHHMLPLLPRRWCCCPTIVLLYFSCRILPATHSVCLF